MKYKNPIALRNALGAKIKNRAKLRGMAVKRYQQIALFELFLGRVYKGCGTDVILKGGFALELRLESARTTGDIDLRGSGDIETLIKRIINSAAEVHAFISFEVTPQTNIWESGPYEGKRLKVQTNIGGQQYGDPFGLDLTMGDALVLDVEEKDGDNVFEFIGIGRLTHRIYPGEAHVAEKLHAISLKFVDGRTNTRMKDLVDVGLFATSVQFQSERLLHSINATFDFRDTHPRPTEMPDVPKAWEVPYANLRAADDLEWNNLAALYSLARRFLNPVLDESTGPTDTWNIALEIWENGSGVD